MATTAVFAEMLVAGIEAVVWMMLFALAIIGREAEIGLLLPLKDWAPLITASLVAIAYGLGVVIDRVSDSLFKVLLKAEPKKTRTTSEEENEDKTIRLRLLVLARGDKVTDFVEYIRSRIRVARATTFNLALTTVAMEAFLLRCTRALPWQVSASVLVLAGLTGLSAFAAFRIGRAYEKWLKAAAVMRFRKHS